MQSRSRPLILLGGSVRAAAADARCAGYDVIAVDRFGDHDLKAMSKRWVEYDAEYRWLEKLRDFRTVPIVPVGGFSWPTAEELTPEIDEFFRSRLIAYPGQASMDQINSPDQLGKIAEASGATFPETRQLVKGTVETVFQPTQRQRQSQESNQWLLKPKNHAGGVGIRLANPESRTESWQFLQRRIRGRSMGANFLALPGPTGPVVSYLGAYGGLTYRRNRDHPFLYGGSFGPLELSSPVLETVRTLGINCAESLSLVGLFNLDLICTLDETLALLEVNPRFGDSMELIGQDRIEEEVSLSLIDWHLTAYKIRNGDLKASHAVFPVRKQAGDPKIHCKRIVYAKVDTRITTYREWQERAMSQKIDVKTHVKLCDVPDDGASINSGAPICTVIVSGGDAKQAVQQSARAAYEIRRGAEA